jgi:hypothetical protein
VARSVAHKLVMHQHRAGGQSQHSRNAGPAPKTDRIQDALNYARRHLKRALTVEELAEADQPECAPVHPRVHGRDRAIPGQGHRGAAAGSGA